MSWLSSVKNGLDAVAAPKRVRQLRDPDDFERDIGLVAMALDRAVHEAAGVDAPRGLEARIAAARGDRHDLRALARKVA
ncbi:MAG TPA: hypothetical protein VH143_13590 [Kofleriaceae bacterium]|jgi:hypothetical protein|nr:hypothetical protein [Kofleriaceae bacterium]